MRYNTQQEKLKLPEYGRNIQQMVQYCRQIEDRDKRNECARTIVAIMGRLFDQLEQSPDSYNPQIESKTWDAVNILADFKLDVDFPCEVINEQSARLQPTKVPYGDRKIKIRTYGRTIEKMIEAVADMPDGPAKESCIMRVAHHMKKQLFLHNKEAADDAIVARDLEWYSQGKISPDPTTFHLKEFIDAAGMTARQNQQKKKKGKFK